MAERRDDPVADGQTWSGLRCELCGVVRMSAMYSHEGVVRCQDHFTCAQVVQLVAAARSTYEDLVEAGWKPAARPVSAEFRLSDEQREALRAIPGLRGDDIATKAVRDAVERIVGEAVAQTTEHALVLWDEKVAWEKRARAAEAAERALVARAVAALKNECSHFNRFRGQPEWCGYCETAADTIRAALAGSKDGEGCASCLAAHPASDCAGVDCWHACGSDDQTCCALPDGGCPGCSNCPHHCVCPGYAEDGERPGVEA